MNVQPTRRIFRLPSTSADPSRPTYGRTGIPDCTHTTAMVDDSATFRRMFTGCYSSLTAVEEDLRRFQLETATSFIRYTSIRAAAHRRRSGLDLPEGFEYKYILYRCVHGCPRRTKSGSKRYRWFDCKARFSVVLKGMFYEISSFHMVHSHDFQIGNPWLYSRNRRLSLEQEATVRSLMCTFTSSQQVRRFITRQFGLHLTRDDVGQLRRRWQADESDLSQVVALLESNGVCRVVKKDCQVRYVFFVPSVFVNLVGRYGELILTDATHQINYGGYVLWHCMFMDVTGVTASFFYALLVNGTAYSYMVAVEAMLEMVPCTSNVRTVVMDKCTAQVNAFRRFYPNASLVFCRFHMMRDISRRCAALRGATSAEKLLLKQLIRNMVFTRDGIQFRRLVRLLRSRNMECFQYLRRTWLPWTSAWASHKLCDVILFGCFTTGRVENENRQLRSQLTERSSLITLFTVVVERVQSVIEQRKQTIAKHCLTSNVFPTEVMVAAPLLRMLSEYARTQFTAHYRSTTVTSVVVEGSDWVLRYGRSSTARVSVEGGIACHCAFHRQWQMPCAHIWKVALLVNIDAHALLRGCRWVLPPLPEPVSVPECDVVSSVEVERTRQMSRSNLTDRASKLHAWRQLSAEIGTQLCSYGSDRFKRMLNSLRLLSEVMSAKREITLYCTTESCHFPIQLDSGANIIRLTGVALEEDDANASDVSTGNLQTVGEVSQFHLPQVMPSDEGTPHAVEPRGCAAAAYTSSRKRKAVLTHRVTEVPSCSSAVSGLKFRRLQTTTSAKYRTQQGARHCLLLSSREGENEVCAICGKEDDACSSVEAV